MAEEKPSSVRLGEGEKVQDGSILVTAGEEEPVTEPQEKKTEEQPSPPAAPEPKEGDENNEYVEGFKLLSVLFGTTVVYFLILLDTSILSTAIPQITTDFHRLQDVGWYGSAYLFSSAALQPLTGKLYTFFSGKWMFLGCVLVFELGSLLCAVSTSSAFFIVGRAVAGVGGSGIQNGGMSVISGAVPAHKRPLYMSFMFAFGQLGILAGPLLGGALTQYTTWRWCFYINLPVGAVAAVVLFFTHAPEPIVKPPFSWALVRRVIPQLDLVGFALLAPAVIMLLLALQYGSSEYPWDSSIVIGLFVGALVTAVVFSLWEWRRGDNALIPFSMVRNRVVWTSTVQFSALMTAVFGGSQYFPIYFQSVRGASPTLSGVYLLPGIVSQMLFVIISGVMVTRLGYYLPWAVVGGAGATLAMGLISTWSPSTSIAMLVGYQIMYGLRGTAVQPAVTAVQTALPPTQGQMGMAFVIFCQGMTASIMLIVANVIFTETLTEQIRIHAPSVNPEAALAAGGSASAVRALLPSGSPEMAGLLKAFSNAFDTLCYLLVAAAAVGFAAAWGMGWVDVRKKKEPSESEA
ncbi:putative MFS multidrug transporter [Xylariomycetidae sp. FL0641]|nr:putative MFS multidrug transporter [Xylariomycetidae sp. FL0641]